MILSLEQNKKVFELNPIGIEDVRWHNDSGCERLEIVISDRNMFWLQVKPEICIEQTVREKA